MPATEAAAQQARRFLGGRPSIRGIGAIVGGAALIATAILLTVTIVGSQQRDHSIEVVKREETLTRYYEDARAASVTQGAAGLSYFTFGDERYLEDLDGVTETLGVAISGLVAEGERAGPEEAARIEVLNTMNEELSNGLNAFLARLDAGDREGALEIVASLDLENRFRDLNVVLNEGAAAARVRLDAAQAADAATQERWSNITIAVGAIWAITTLISMALLLLWIVRPVSRVARAAHALRSGDLSARVTADGLRETHELATAFNAMAAQIQESTEQLQIAATTDDLTAIPNHRFLMETLDREIERSLRYGHPLTLLMMDIDGFKQFNDAYGHQAGDAVLRQVASILRLNTRQVDVVGRYGGDEFMAILPETDRGLAIGAAKRLLEALADARIRVDDSHEVQVALSLGVAVCPDDSKDKRDLLAHADTALYEAKTEAGNSLRVARSAA
jgi:diguanylate cyclase (GGDEF)-like protein